MEKLVKVLLLGLDSDKYDMYLIVDTMKERLLNIFNVWIDD